MDETWLRLLVVAVMAAIVVGAAYGTRRWQRPGHARLDLAGSVFAPGVVMFTSTDCTTCKDALAAVKPLDIPLREVTWELEGNTLEQLDVSAVPLTVFVGNDGEILDQTVGVPRRRWLRRAAAKWRRTVTA
ncbi:MAG TPA: hypothetical protein VLG28_05880 [Acidimicrobiia bacterium]|jgi:hypothetical protein|nr:hypothetical protein [Acidimicrobiia bacterium]